MVISDHSSFHCQGDSIYSGIWERDSMLPIKIGTPSQQSSQFNKKENEAGLRCVVDLVDEIRDVVYVREFSAKLRKAKRYNSKVVQMKIHQGDLVQRQVVEPAHQGKLQCNWEEPYCICQKLPQEAYKLDELDGQLIPRTWNSLNIRYYCS